MSVVASESFVPTQQRPDVGAGSADPRARHHDRDVAVGGSGVADPERDGSLAGIGAYARDHARLSLLRRPVVTVPSQRFARIRSGRPVAGVAGHRNWLEPSDFDLPPDRFSRYLDAPVHNIVDVVHEAVARLSGDGLSVVRPIGSVAYARADRRLNWDLVRDLDLWVYVTSDTLKSGEWFDLHVALQNHVHNVLRERGLWVHQSPRTGYVYLRQEDQRQRMVELKLADLNWLREGLRQAHERSPLLVRGPIPAHFEVPRLEWAGYTPYENYFPNPAARSTFDSTLRTIRRADVSYGLNYTYAENLAEAYRTLTPARIAKASARPRFFFRYVRKVLKKQLMLAVMRRDVVEQARVVGELDMMRTGESIAFERRARVSYLGDLVERLRHLRAAGVPMDQLMSADFEERGHPRDGPH